MAETSRHDAWAAAGSYDAYMGRWSRQIAPLFLDWLAMRGGFDWVELGCGTGALTAEILARCRPARVLAIDPAAGFVAAARAAVDDPRVEFRVGDAAGLAALPAGGWDVAVSALALNFVPDPVAALAEMRRVVRPGGAVAFYVWDYPGGGVGFMRAFWEAATAVDPAAAELTEVRRFGFCTRDGLLGLARQAGLTDAEATALEAATVFADFDDLWRPFTLGAGPAPGYCASLPEAARERLRQRLSDTLPRGTNGTITLGTRAWAVRARVDPVERVAAT